MVSVGGLVLAAYTLWHFSVPMPAPRPVPMPERPSLFAAEYPASGRFREELKNMRATNQLSPVNEALIQEYVTGASKNLKMPSAVLWCLFFQESRLNHLEGINQRGGSRGLGQFGQFSFFEINNQIQRYGADNLSMAYKVLGRDVRPLEPRNFNPEERASYFYIPTAVVSSAAFLNNRYHQLRRNLDRKQIKYDPDLLWLYAAMAYNKGTRSVLSLWSDARRDGGKKRLEKILTEKEELKKLANAKVLTRALRRIWSPHTAVPFARELKIHLENMRSCSLRES